VKAIETRYKGYRFRSRLEARWAVFFDALGLDWVYEPEGYTDGKINYLPDFYISVSGSDNGFFVEIKPTSPTLDEWGKIGPAIMSTHKSVFFLIGQPQMLTVKHTSGGIRLNGAIAAGATYHSDTDRQVFNPHHPQYPNVIMMPTVQTWCVSNASNAITLYDIHFNSGLNLLREIQNGDVGIKMYAYDPVSQDFNRTFVPSYYIGGGYQYNHPALFAAYEAARSARFEHGETPIIP